jgi:hypothetical protein
MNIVYNERRLREQGCLIAYMLHIKKYDRFVTLAHFHFLS